MKVVECPDCNVPCADVWDPVEGRHRRVELRERDGGKYEIAGSIMRERRTKNGKPRMGGKGLRLHGQNCIAVKRDLEAAVERGDVKTRKTSLGQHVPQRTPKAPPRPPRPIPAVLIEIQDVTGTDQDFEGQPSGYIDWTGPLGPGTCAACQSPVLVCAHVSRPDGTRPVILHNRKHVSGSWRAYMKRDNPDLPLAEFVGEHDGLGFFFNHRVICPKARHDG